MGGGRVTERRVPRARTQSPSSIPDPDCKLASPGGGGMKGRPVTLFGLGSCADRQRKGRPGLSPPPLSSSCPPWSRPMLPPSPLPAQASSVPHTAGMCTAVGGGLWRGRGQLHLPSGVPPPRNPEELLPSPVAIATAPTHPSVPHSVPLPSGPHLRAPAQVPCCPQHLCLDVPRTGPTPHVPSSTLFLLSRNTAIVHLAARAGNLGIVLTLPSLSPSALH